MAEPTAVLVAHIHSGLACAELFASASGFVLRSQVLEDYDIDSSGRLELTEFNKLVMDVRALLAAESIFERFDANRDGKIDKQELRPALLELGLDAGKRRAEQARGGERRQRYSAVRLKPSY